MASCKAMLTENVGLCQVRRDSRRAGSFKETENECKTHIAVWYKCRSGDFTSCKKDWTWTKLIEPKEGIYIYYIDKQ